MIPLTKEAREGLTRMVAVADCGKPGLRDPKMTAAMAWIESLPPGPILLWKAGGGTMRCDACPFRAGTRACTAKQIFGLEQCPIEGGGMLVVGVP